MNDLSLFPTDTGRNNAGRRGIGGCDVSTLAAEFGTPLYIYDETTLRQNCRAYIQPLQARYPNASVTYAGKAYLDPTVLSIIRDEGLGLDAVSGGEISLALAGGFPPEDIVFHGNNKLPHEIALASRPVQSGEPLPLAGSEQRVKRTTTVPALCAGETDVLWILESWWHPVHRAALTAVPTSCVGVGVCVTSAARILPSF